MQPVKRRNRVRPLSIAVFAVIALSSLACSLAVRSVVEGQEAKLLKERTAEATVVLGSLFNTPRATLPLLAGTTRPRPESSGLFLVAAEAMRGGFGTISAAKVADADITVFAVAGEDKNPVVSAPLADLLRRALSQQSASAVINGPHGGQLTFAAAAGDGIVVYQEFPLAAFAAIPQGNGGFFSELEGAVYASAEPDPSAVIIRTAKTLPMPGRVERQTFKFGPDTWSIVAKSTEPLVGQMAEVMPWLVLGFGVLAAFLITLLVETLSRRREYAMALVDERTQALRDALEEQARLEQGQRQAREAAEAANRSKSEFLSRMSHELRTPLNAVLGFGQLLELDDLSDQQQESVEQIVKGGRHLLHLINEVLDISRIETGSLPLSPESVSVAEVVDDSVTLMRPLADQREVRIVHDSGVPAGSHVRADRQRLKQVLLNLLANAVKYNRHGGSVTVSTAVVDGARLRITVGDTGPGIPAELLDRLFVPFDRLGAERTDVEGAGVGLALSRRLAEAMDGVLTVDSVVGEGSAFSVELPLAEDPVERYDRMNGDADPIEAPTPAESRHTVLYIEDNVSNVRLVERVLEQRGDVDMIPAMQGRLGIGLAHEHRPDLILVDLHLPDMDGSAVLAQLRADPVTASTPIVVVSADATESQVERLMAQGATAYLTKPLDVPQFLAVLNKVLEAAAAPSR